MLSATQTGRRMKKSLSDWYLTVGFILLMYFWCKDTDKSEERKMK